ncbi:integrase [Bacteroides maternus]|uniref:integrase n=1 Tax=Bacteroides maternus TaxID=3117552 RepID=UPI003CC79F2D
MFPKQAANSLVTETLQYFVLFCRSDYHAILVKCLIINDLRLIRTILFFIAFLNITYVARHTWATLAYNEDIPVAKISAGLSHASEEITHTYLRSFSDEQLAVVNLQMAALVNPMAEKEWKRKEKGKRKGNRNDKESK